MALDLLLTAALAVVAVQANRASGTASAVAQSDRNRCLSANVSPAQPVSLWNYVLTCRSSSRRATALMSTRRARDHGGEISQVKDLYRTGQAFPARP